VTSPEDSGGLWIRFLSGPDIDALGLTSAEILLWHRGLSVLDIAVGALILRRAADADAGTMLRYH